MVLRYRSRISSLLNRLSTLRASAASRALRLTVRSWVRYAFRTYCWVIVDAPWPPSCATLAHSARSTPRPETPEWS
jgi:hypothetical protein